MSAKFRTLHFANVTFLGSGSGTSYIITHCHFLCCGHTVYERPGSLQKASGEPLGSFEILLFPLCHFFQPILERIRELVPGFLIICSAELPIRTNLNSLTTPPIARLSHEWKLITLLLFVIGILLPYAENSFEAFFFWGGGDVLIIFSQCNTRNFADMSNLLGNTLMKYLFLILTLFWVVYVEGVRRGSPWTGSWVVHGPSP